MSGEVKLKCRQRCPQATCDQQRTSFIASGKLSDNFWVDLLERKCPEGLGEVSINLKNGGFLTAEDFVCLDQEQINEADPGRKTGSYSCSIGQETDCDGFKTPCTQKKQRIITTPCLFSQVEGSQLCSQNIGEDATLDVLNTPASLPNANLSDHHSIVGFSLLSSPLVDQISPDAGPCISSPQGNGKSLLHRTHTPDLLAMMSSQRPSVKSLSHLLAEDSNNDTAEWSESMATPPLKWDQDDTDNKAVLVVAKDTACDDHKEPAPNKPVARVLFSRGTARGHASDLSTTLLTTLEETDITGLESCKPLSESPDQLRNTTKSEAIVNIEQLEHNLQSDTPKDTSRFIHTLAQSTPKPDSMQLDSCPLFGTPVTRPKSSPIPSDKRRVTGHERVHQQRDVCFEPVSTPSTVGNLSQAADKPCTSVAALSNGHVDTSDVGFGSPSQSFELAMAREADKLALAVECNTKMPGVGDVRCVSPVLNEEIIKRSNSQGSSASPSIYDDGIGKASPEYRPKPLQEQKRSLRRRSSPWKAAGLRRLSKGKRFSYPVLDQVSSEDKDDNKRTLPPSSNESAREVGRATESLNADCQLKTKEGIFVSQMLQTSYKQELESRTNRNENAIPTAATELRAYGGLEEKDLSPSKMGEKNSTSMEDELHFTSNQGEQTTVLKSRARRNLSVVDVSQPKRPKLEGQVIPGWSPTESHQKTRSTCVNDGKSSMIPALLIKKEAKMPINGPGSVLLSTASENTSCVGFHTGSGNLITVSEGALEKARSMLSAVIEEDDRDASGYSRINYRSDKAKPLDGSRAAENENLVDMDDLSQFPVECMSPSNTSHFAKTSVSTDPTNPQVTVGQRGDCSALGFDFIASGEGMVSEQVASSMDCGHCFTNSFHDCLSRVEINPGSAVEFVGFRTAAGKTVEISEKALKKARGILQDLETSLDAVNADLKNRDTVGGEDNETSQQRRQSGSVSAKVTTANMDKNTVSNRHPKDTITRRVHVASLDDESCIRRARTVPEFCGFQTASERNTLKIPEEALKRATTTMREIDVSLGLAKGDVDGTYAELSKQVAAEACSATVAECESDSPGVTEFRGQTGLPFQGFQTASGKTVRVSEKSLQRARRTISEIDREIMHLQPTFEKMNRKEGKEPVENVTLKVEIGDQELARDGASRSAITRDQPGGGNEEEIPTETPEEATSIVDANERKTEGDNGSWKHSLERTKYTHESRVTDANDARVFAIEASTEKMKAMECVANQIVQATGKDSVDFDLAGLSSVQTASGNCTVDVSEEAFERAMMTMDAVEQGLQCGAKDVKKDGNIGFTIFQTVSGRDIDVSVEAVNRGRITMESVDLQNVTCKAHQEEDINDNKVEISTHQNTRDVQGVTGMKNQQAGCAGFMGLYTASGPQVNISEEALKKARATMHEIDQDLQSGEQKVRKEEHVSFAGFQTASGKQVRVSEEALKKARMTMNQIEQDLQSGAHKVRKEEHVSLAGFQTAGGKQVRVSEEALKKARMTMNQIEQDLQSGAHKVRKEEHVSLAGFQTAGGKQVRVSEEALKKARMTMNQIEQDLQSGAHKVRKEEHVSLAGFQTAGGKQVRVSEEALKKARMTMNQIDQDLQSGAQKLEKEGDLGFAGFAGFQTASGKQVSVSEEAPKKARMTMNQSDQELQSGAQKVGKDGDSGFAGFTGFQTASGKQVSISEEAMQKARLTMNQIDQELQSGAQKVGKGGDSGFAGFQTANGKQVSVSEEAMQKARLTMNQIDQELQSGAQKVRKDGDSGFVGFQTASGKHVSVSEEALKKARLTMNQIDQDLQSGEQKVGKDGDSGFTGFQTASGKQVSVSEEALKKARMTMNQIDQELQSGAQKVAKDGDSGFVGFQTASGKHASVSEEALKKARMTMNQIDQELQSGAQKVRKDGDSGFAGFQTPSGKHASVSEEALKKARMTMNQIDQELQSGAQKVRKEGDSGFAGFQTASGKHVSVSEEALKKARLTMNQIDQDLQSGAQKVRKEGDSGFAGFQTASGKQVNVSEEALKKARMTMDQIEHDIHQSDAQNIRKEGHASFAGFQTASGKQVNVSEEALKKARTTMDQIDRDIRVCRNKDGDANSRICPTEGGQKIEGSVESKTDSKIQEVETVVGCRPSGSGAYKMQAAGGQREVSFSGDTLPRKQMTTYQQKNSKVISGSNGSFQTASGRMVEVSEDALAKARATLDEIDRGLGEANTPDGVHVLKSSPLVGNCESEMPVSKLLKTEGCFRSEVALQVISPSPALGISDDAVSREILESSNALLADESFQEFLPTNNWGNTTPCSAERKNLQGHRDVHPQALPTVKTPYSRFIPRANSTPLINHDNTPQDQVRQRSEMKAMTSTPVGVLCDRRSSRFSLPLTPKTISPDTNTVHHLSDTGIFTGSRVTNRFSRTQRSSSHVRSDSPRLISPIQTSASHTPEISRNALPLLKKGTTPFSSTAGRNSVIPRPHFSTPYRKGEAARRVHGSSAGVSSESGNPIAKRPRLSGPPGAMPSEHGGISKNDSKGSSKVKPQFGFLSKLRQHQPRTSLRQYVGNMRPARYTIDELCNLGVNEEVVSVTCSNAASFRFDGAKYFSEGVRSTNQGTRTEDGGLLRLAADGWLGLEEIQSAFLSTPGVVRRLISDEWIQNHYRWIVWKLAAMEVAFPLHFAGRCLTPNWTLCQLKYRYDREVDHSHRSSLKKILERDDVSTRTMVLCVSSVCVPQDTKEENVAPDDRTSPKQEGAACEQKPAVIQVTDGWYGARALLDKPLTNLLAQGRIHVGQKLCVYGADLVGSDQAASPLEAPSSLMLRFHANSTRRARWDARLGLQRHAHAFSLQLTSLFPDGGLIGCIDVIVLRQYPLQWMEKMPDGSNVFRSPRAEEREAQRFDQERQRRREALFIRVQQEFEKESSRPELDKKRQRKGGRRSFNPSQVETLREGKDIYDAFSIATDPDAFMNSLDDEQRKLLDRFTGSFRESRCIELQAKFERAWREQEEHQTERNVVALLKVRVADHCQDSGETKTALLSVWRPSKEVMSLLSEGAHLKIYHATASACRHRQRTSEIQLSGTRTTRYQALSVDPEVKCRVYSERQTTSFRKLSQKLLSPYAEVDLVGLVVFCSPQAHSSVQTVYLADEEQNLVAIKFWGGLKAHALDGLVKQQCLVASSNLLVRLDDHVACACLTFGDLSSLTLRPREVHLRRALETLQSSIESMDVFMAKAQEKLDSVLSKGFPIWSKQTRSHVASPDTPGMDRGEDPATKTLNSSRDSTKRADPGLLSRGMKSRQCKRKLLESISEPPPLSPLTCAISADARKEFKRPKQVSEALKHEHQ